MKKRLISLLLAVGMMLSLFPVSAFAESQAGTPKPFEVSTADELKTAVDTINSQNGGEYEISLQANVALPADSSVTLQKNTTTILGNGHTLSGGMDQTLAVSGSGTVLNLGQSVGGGVTGGLTLDGEQASGMTAVQVSNSARLNMYEGVTIQNYTNSGVRVGAGAAFEMSGGTIQNCSGTNGGGVAVSGSRNGNTLVITHAVFTLSGGTIKDCTAVNEGGGVLADYAECTVSGGSIVNCSAVQGGGISFKDGALTVSGGTISGCRASSDSTGGGGIAITNTAADTSMNFTGGSIVNNQAGSGNGGGICVMSLGNFTAEAVEGLTVTGNSALNGGGIYIMNMGANIGVGQEGYVDMSSDTNILCNNTADAAGADVYISYGSIKLPAAVAMKQNYGTTGHKIDGWYIDGMKAGTTGLGETCERYTPNEHGEAQIVTSALSGPIALVASYQLVRSKIKLPDPNSYDAAAENTDGAKISDALCGEEVRLSFDTAKLPEDKLFDQWKVTDANGCEVPVKQDNNGYYFEMSECDVTVSLVLKPAKTDPPAPDPVEPVEPSDPDEPGKPDDPDEPESPDEPNVSDPESSIVGGVLLGAAAGAVGYYAGTGMYLEDLFGYVPANRQALAAALWEKAGKPEPQSAALYTDVDEQDLDAQKADRWCVEQGLISSRGEDTFRPAGWVTHTQCLVSWHKLQKMLEQ